MTKKNLKKQYPLKTRIEICGSNPWAPHKGTVIGHKKVMSGMGVHIMLDCEWDIIVTNTTNLRKID